jgi:hypothetical protein
MLKFKLLSFVLLCFSFSASSQRANTYKIMPGERILDIIPPEEVYQYKQFQNGVIYFKSGVKSSAKLNYSFLTEEFLFIDTKGDTLSLANPGDVKTAVIGADHFFYTGNRFVKQDTLIGENMLAVTAFFTTSDRRRVSAFGTTTDAGSDSYSSFEGGSFGGQNAQRFELTPQVITILSRKQVLFIGNKFGRFVPVDRKNLFLFYAEQQPKLKAYLDSREVNFYSRKSMIDLVAYMNAPE